ncbi:unnamed protein product, partial [Gulo gulo]
RQSLTVRRSVPGVQPRRRVAWPVSSSERQRDGRSGVRALSGALHGTARRYAPCNKPLWPSAPRQPHSRCRVRLQEALAPPVPARPPPSGFVFLQNASSLHLRRRSPWPALVSTSSHKQRPRPRCPPQPGRARAPAATPIQPPSRRRGPGGLAGRTGLRLPRDWPVEVSVHAPAPSLAGKAPTARPPDRTEVGGPCGSGGVGGSFPGLRHVRGGRGRAADGGRGRGRARWRTGLVVSAGSQPDGGAAARPRAPEAGAGRGALAAGEPLFSPGERAAGAGVAGPLGLRGWASAERFGGRRRPFLRGAPTVTRGAVPRAGPARRAVRAAGEVVLTT